MLFRSIRAVAIPISVGLLVTLTLAWPVPMLLLQYGGIVHTNPVTSHPWTAPCGVSCGVGLDHRALSDWFVLRPVRPEQSRLPFGERGRVPYWAAVPAAPDPDLYKIDTAATGWPWRAFASESWLFTGPIGLVRSREVLRGNLVLATTQRGRTVLPLRPMWPGLLGDVALFGGGWALAGALLGLRRRRVRGARGRCSACGYDLHGQSIPGCPECGRGRPA